MDQGVRNLKQTKKIKQKKIINVLKERNKIQVR